MLLVNCACTHTLNFALNSLETESLMVKMDSKTSLCHSPASMCLGSVRFATCHRRAAPKTTHTQF